MANLEAWVKESESKVWAAREREANKELEKELLISKKEVMEQHEKGFDKVVRQVEFFTKVLDLGDFDPFKDVKDDILLDEDNIASEEEVNKEEQGDDATI